MKADEYEQERTYYILHSDLCYYGLNGQDISVTTAFDSTEIYLGDQIYFTIKVEQPSGAKLDVQQFSDTITKNIEIISGPYSDTSAIPDDRLRIINKYLITSFDSGFYMVPPVYAETSEGKGMKRFYSDYSQLEVRRFNTAPADTTASIYDIVGPTGSCYYWRITAMASPGGAGRIAGIWYFSVDQAHEKR